MIFISDVQNYVPIILCKTAGSIYLFQIIGTLKGRKCKINSELSMGYIRDRLGQSHSDF